MGGGVASNRAGGYSNGTMTSDTPQSMIRIARESGETEVAPPVDLGARVRELRKARNWTLEQAATQAGLARSTLSKIESGQMSPTYAALKKLAVGLEISVPQLFTPPAFGQINRRMAVTKAGTGSARRQRHTNMNCWATRCAKSRCCRTAPGSAPGKWRSLMVGSGMTAKSFFTC